MCEYIDSIKWLLEVFLNQQIIFKHKKMHYVKLYVIIHFFFYGEHKLSGF